MSPGSYKISLDFIKIDSWDNENAEVNVNDKIVGQVPLLTMKEPQICAMRVGRKKKLPFLVV